MQAKVLVVGLFSCLLLFGCEKQIKEEAPEVAVIMAGKHTIDVNSYAELAGDADYVIVGEVKAEISVDYRWPSMIEQEDGSVKEVTVPYTSYSVQVLDNLEGTLSQEAPITITKVGGLTKEGDQYMLYENDNLPEVGKQYVFYIYAQEDGSNLASGPNSTIPLDENSAITSRTSQGISENILGQIKDGIENKIVRERERDVSNDDTSINE